MVQYVLNNILGITDMKRQGRTISDKDIISGPAGRTISDKEGKTISDKEGKTISDKDKIKKQVNSLKSRITAISRGVVSPKMILNEAYAMAQALQGGSGGRTISDNDIENIIVKLKKKKVNQGGSGGRNAKGGKIKVYAKGGGVRKPNY